MDFSASLATELSKGSFPLLGTAGLVLWRELMGKLETKPVETMQAVRKLMEDRKINLDTTYFSDVVTVNGVDLVVSFDEFGRFLGAMHERLARDHTVGSSEPVQQLIQRLRVVAISNNVLEQSGVTLAPVDPHTLLGTGLTTQQGLTYIPDPSLGVSFGSVPNQQVITAASPGWGKISKRVHEKRMIPGQTQPVYGRKKHYVLAHLLNHNVNGSGADPSNLVAFSADGNTQMAKSVEKFLKQLVLLGHRVNYTVKAGPAVGMTTGRAAALAACTMTDQRDIVTAEQYLPSYLTITLQAWDGQAWKNIVAGLKIDNYVPETVPLV